MRTFQIQAVHAGAVVLFEGHMYLVTAIVADEGVYVIRLSGGHAAYRGEYFPLKREVSIHRSRLTGL